MRTLVLILVGLSTVVGFVARAGAQSPDELLAAGLELREQGRDEEALDLFQRAYDVDPTPRARAQVALAEQALGRWLDAEQHLSEALGHERDPWIRGRRRVLEAALAEIRSHIGELDVDVDVTGAELRVGGRAVGELPLDAPLRLPMGTVEIEVVASGYREAHRTVEIRAGELSRESIALVPAPEELGPSPPGGADTTPATVLIVLGGVALVTTIVGALWWIDRQREVDFCASASCTNREELDSTRDAAAATTLISAALSAALGVTGWLLWPGADDQPTIACGLGPAAMTCRLPF
jgi:tetratricopeptide (TPR) repeat protein